MRAAHVAGTHRTYAAKTLLYAGVLGVAGSVIGVYAAAGLLSVLDVSEAALRGTLPRVARVRRRRDPAHGARAPQTLPPVDAGVGDPRRRARGRDVLRAVGAARPTRSRSGRRSTPPCPGRSRSCTRSRSGMPFPRVMDTLAENEAVYGEAATELSVAVRDMNAFGTDALTALQRTSRRTPSDDLADFAENLASVLGTGQPISTFLSDQYELYQEEAESKQQQYLELLSTFAEAYVTALVAGPLFFITILVVIGLVLEDTLPCCASWSTSGYRWRRSGSWSTSTASRRESAAPRLLTSQRRSKTNQG